MIDVCICSYKRPELLETLIAVAGQTGIAPEKLRVIVADNTADAQSHALVERAAAQLPLMLHYVHAPADNISIARNACLDHAISPWIAFIDDDEIPTPGWLTQLLAEAGRGNWDVVLGPVKAVYPGDAPAWARDGDFHSTYPVHVGGTIRTAYTGNVLFRRDLVEKNNLRFRIDLGKTGGEDEDFFYRAFDAGGRIGFAPKAAVYERVPITRANMNWLLRRNFRAGQSHGSRLEQRKSRMRDIALASAKAAFCGAGAVVWGFHAVRRNRYLTRAALHMGVVARLSGWTAIELY
jgi:succinoglycan biosynthesis protein ExoM